MRLSSKKPGTSLHTTNWTPWNLNVRCLSFSYFLFVRYKHIPQPFVFKRLRVSDQVSHPVAYTAILFRLCGRSKNSVEDRGQRERVSGGGSPLVRGSGGSCNLVQEISFHIVKFS